ncbi:MAG: hypothetical protein HC854_17510 [Flavobacterium sp.]|nr:hypothetical protein [Flavobacterium sp.]
MIITKNPEAYISRQKGVLKRKTMQLNYKSYGSPICISANALQTNFDSLYQNGNGAIQIIIKEVVK